MTGAVTPTAVVYRTALVVVVLDQLSKAWASSNLQPGVVSPLLPGLLQLRLVFNTGAAFSLLTGNALLLRTEKALYCLEKR